MPSVTPSLIVLSSHFVLVTYFFYTLCLSMYLGLLHYTRNLYMLWALFIIFVWLVSEQSIYLLAHAN